MSNEVRVLCVLPHADDDPRQQDVGLLCNRHYRRMGDDVTEIGLLVVDTQSIVQGGITGAPVEDGPRGKHQAKRADPPAPGDVALMALYDARNATARLPDDQSDPVPAVLAVIASWTLLVAEERPLTQTLPRSVLAQLDLLKRHHPWIAAQDFVDDYILEMRELRKALASAVRDHKFTPMKKCPVIVDRESAIEGEFTTGLCNGQLLRENGTDLIRCASCQTRWVSDQERARLAVMMEESA